MPNFQSKRPKCKRNRDKLERSEYRSGTQRMPSGAEVDVTYFDDGSSTYHFGGPCGDVNYDSNGEEC